MKKQILFTLVLVLVLFSATESFSQYGLSKGKVDNNFNINWKGQNTNFPASASNCGEAHTDAYTGTIIVNLDNVPNVPFYCLDLCTDINLGDSIVDSASTIQEAIYITNNFYPAKPNVLPSVNDEACAVQMAIWHFRNLLVIDSVTGPANIISIRARAQTIINETIANSGSAVVYPTLQILPAVNPDDFYVRTIDTAGNPISVNGITLSITGGGTLSTYTVNTDVTGNSPDVIVTGAVNGSEISANATVQIPGGITYCGLNAIKQLLVLGKTTLGIRTATTTWGALPVELSSFTSMINDRNVTLHWSTTSESNNSGFDIERSVANSGEWTKVGYLNGFGTSEISHNYSYTDRNLATGSYSYRLKQIDYNGNFEYHNLNSEVIIGIPAAFNLRQNYPNPFNPTTTINFDMPKDGFVTLKVYNTSGKEVATLVNETKTAGYYTISFNAATLSSGVYYYRLESNGISKVMKMALIK
ncbi:MAG TPA: T9SS type A sorting domain-containing protein [Ignavibacteria bacterium]|nr:T9SS type A sorting domain-containing protein [Ignavibacteria bacterium]HMR41672.1 T9SS type A sorting domain-containing protein [Ignavibacteria bacterium]